MEWPKFRYWANDSDWDDQHKFYKWVPDVVFSTEEYLALNANLDLIKVDPDSAIIRRSENIKFDSYTLCKFDNTSPIRADHKLYLVNRERKKYFELDGSNAAIYAMWSEIMENNKVLRTQNNTDLWDETFKFLQSNVYQYVKFFFNSVKGRHGRFEIVDTKEDLKNRINTYYVTSNTEESDDLKIVFEKFPDLDERLELIISQIFVDLRWSINNLDELYQFKNILMIFKDSLFCANVIISTKDESYGEITLKNERMIYLNLRDLNYSFGEPTGSQFPDYIIDSFPRFKK